MESNSKDEKMFIFQNRPFLQFVLGAFTTILVYYMLWGYYFSPEAATTNAEDLSQVQDSNMNWSNDNQGEVPNTPEELLQKYSHLLPDLDDDEKDPIGKESFACGNSITDIDQNVYNTLQIGDQCWMKENLTTSFFSNGDEIPHVISQVEWVDLQTGAWSFYDNELENGRIFGKLYNWYAVADNRGICPAGWRVPNDSDWKVLEGELGMPIHERAIMGPRGWENNIGGILKTVGNEIWKQPNTGATNDRKFSALPGGARLMDGYYDLGINGLWWTATEYNSTQAIDRMLSFGTGGIIRSKDEKVFGYSVRCLL